jgi:SSS family solute:Na+ symporter
MGMHWIDWLILVSLATCLCLFVLTTRRYMQGVADFLAAGRCARRYLLGTAGDMASTGAVNMVASMQMLYIAGLTASYWVWMSIPVGLFISISGFVVYRFRATRVFTIGELFERRYSRNFRKFAGFVAFGAGLITFGIFPAVAARFFIHFCGFPDSFVCVGLEISTFPALMAFLLVFAVSFTWIGGQISVLVTDFLQGLFCSVLYIVIVIVLLGKVSVTQISEALLMAPVTDEASLINPFKTRHLESFNYWYFIMATLLQLYAYKTFQGSAGYNCSPETPHEAKMAGILSGMRAFSLMLLYKVLPLVAIAVMFHPDLAALGEGAKHILGRITNEEVVSQMTVPVALRQVMPVGLVGAFAAIFFAAFLSTHTTMLHSWAGVFVQDVVLPFRKSPITTEQHIKLLRGSLLGVAVFVFLFSLFFKQTEHLNLFFMITGAIYSGGAGACLLGGLYWKRGTTGGAWAAMILGPATAITGIVLRSVFEEHFPISTLQLTFLTMIVAVLGYVLVSLIGSRIKPFNMDRFLYRGKYALEEDQAHGAGSLREKMWKRFGMGPEFTRGDRFIYIYTCVWATALFSVFLVLLYLGLTREISDAFWLDFWKVWLSVIFVFAVTFTVWFTIGGCFDLKHLYGRLRSRERDHEDDGIVKQETR